MGLYILYGILAALGALILFMIIRTMYFWKKKPSFDFQPKDVDVDEIADVLSKAVQVPTVTKYNEGDDESSFLTYHEFLKKSFPLIFARAEVTKIKDYSLIIKVNGTDEALLPACFLAHQDVVPATKDGWEVDPFSGEIKDGYVYGRGSQDMKSQMITALFGLELILREGKEPVRTIYFCFGHDEEATGKNGARNIVAYLKEKGVRFAYVLDEGGTIFDGKILGIKGKLALIGTCEKGYADFILTAEKDGGHASNPKKKSSVDIIADAIHDLRRTPMRSYWSKPAREMFFSLMPYMDPIHRFIFANRDIFSPLLKRVLAAINPIMNSLFRTTFAFTQMKGSDAPNVIPVKATAVVNTRINIGQTADQVKEYIQKVVGNEVKVENYGYGFDPTPISKTKGSDVYATLSRSIEEVFSGFVAAPFPFIAATDAKHYYPICDNVYRFTPFEVTIDDQKRIHGLNERCEIESLRRATQFFRRFMENTCY